MAERVAGRPPSITLNDEPKQEEIETLTVVQAFTAKAGFDIATITGTSNVPVSGTFTWGTATGVYTNVTPLVQSTYEYQADNTLQFRLTFTLRNVQLAANQAYFGKIFFSDGTSSSELTWTQPGIIPSGSDQVFFYDRVLSDFATIRDIAGRGASQGWLLPSEWAELIRLGINTAWLNTVKWNDGR